MKKTTLLLFIMAGFTWGCTTDALHSDLQTEESFAESRGKKFVPFKGEMAAN